VYVRMIGRGNPLVRAIMRRDRKIVQQLLQTGFNPNISDCVGNLALHLSVMTEDIEIVKLLLEANADPNLLDDLTESELLWAIAGNKQDIAHLLLAHGVNPDQESLDSEHGTSPRKLAKQLGHFELDD
jgi:ankyrin repeat protein